jgi:hypothetical protein
MKTKEANGKNFLPDLKRAIIGLQAKYKRKGRISRKEADRLSIYWNVYMNQFNS